VNISPIWAMTGDGAESIRQRLCQNGVEMIGARGEGSRGCIRALVQSDVSMANLTEDIDGNAVCPTPPRFLNDFVPQGTEFVLQFGMGIAYVKLRK